jgi:hypothetical protein
MYRQEPTSLFWLIARLPQRPDTPACRDCRIQDADIPRRISAALGSASQHRSPARQQVRCAATIHTRAAVPMPVPTPQETLRSACILCRLATPGRCGEGTASCQRRLAPGEPADLCPAGVPKWAGRWTALAATERASAPRPTSRRSPCHRPRHHGTCLLSPARTSDALHPSRRTGG